MFINVYTVQINIPQGACNEESAPTGIKPASLGWMSMNESCWPTLTSCLLSLNGFPLPMLLQHFVLGEAEEETGLRRSTVWKQARKSSPSLGSWQLLTNCTRQKNKEPNPSAVEVEAETPTDFKGSWVSASEHISPKCKYWKSCWSN